VITESVYNVPLSNTLHHLSLALVVVVHIITSRNTLITLSCSHIEYL